MGSGSPWSPVRSHPKPYDPLPHEHWFVGLAWAWDFLFKTIHEENRKK